MSVFSTKASFAIAAAVVGVVSMASTFTASAGPLILKKPCNNLVGCNPNTWTPTGHHNHWNGGYGGGLSISFAQPQAMDEGDCYYVRRKVFIPQVGMVSKRQLVCN
jgi:hypothetical protein